jgi:hypothetical protein
MLAPGVPAFALSNTCSAGRYRIDKEAFTDPQRETLLQYTRFSALTDTLSSYLLFLLLSPYIGNKGFGDTGWVGDYKGVRVTNRRGLCTSRHARQRACPELHVMRLLQLMSCQLSEEPTKPTERFNQNCPPEYEAPGFAGGEAEEVPVGQDRRACCHGLLEQFHAGEARTSGVLKARMSEMRRSQSSPRCLPPASSRSASRSSSQTETSHQQSASAMMSFPRLPESTTIPRETVGAVKSSNKTPGCRRDLGKLAERTYTASPSVGVVFAVATQAGRKVPLVIHVRPDPPAWLDHLNYPGFDEGCAAKRQRESDRIISKCRPREQSRGPSPRIRLSCAVGFAVWQPASATRAAAAQRIKCSRSSHELLFIDSRHVRGTRTPSVYESQRRKEFPVEICCAAVMIIRQESQRAVTFTSFALTGSLTPACKHHFFAGTYFVGSASKAFAHPCAQK